MRAKRARTSTHTSRYIWIGSAFIIGFVLLVGIMLTTRQDEFTKAVDNPDLRPAFVARMLTSRPLPPNIPHAEYIHTKEEYNAIMRGTRIKLLLEGSIQALAMAVLTTTSSESVLFIFPDSFSGDAIKTERDWIAALEHEYYHADQLAKGGIETETLGVLAFAPEFHGIKNRALQRAIMEMDAIREDLTRADISDSFRENQEKMYTIYYLRIWADGAISDQRRSELKIEFFPFYLIDPSSVNPGGGMYLVSPEHKRYDFTRGEMERIFALTIKKKS